jgi:hypothetical protein
VYDSHTQGRRVFISHNGTPRTRAETARALYYRRICHGQIRRLSVAALTLDEKLKRQRKIKSLESVRNTKRKSLFDAQDDIDRRCDALIESIEAKLKTGYTKQVLFETEWRLR